MLHNTLGARMQITKSAQTETDYLLASLCWGPNSVLELILLVVLNKRLRRAVTCDCGLNHGFGYRFVNCRVCQIVTSSNSLMRIA